MSRPVTLGFVAVAALCLWAPPARAEIDFGIEEPRVFSIQERPFHLGHEFQLAIGILPLDAFYVGLTIGGSYTYHFSDFWAWEIASFHYSINFDTSLEQDLDDQFGVVPVRGGGERTQLFATTNVVVKPFFGKLVLLNREVIYSETFFSLGLGPFQSVSGTGESSYFDPALALGVGLRFWVAEVLSVRFEVRDFLVFKNVLIKQDNLTRQEEGVVNTLLFQLSVALNFSNIAEEEGATPEEAFGSQKAARPEGTP